jgi:hypothetical protein
MRPATASLLRPESSPPLPFTRNCTGFLQEQEKSAQDRRMRRMNRRKLLQNPVGFAGALAVFLPGSCETAFSNDCPFKAEVLKEPRSAVFLSLQNKCFPVRASGPGAL